jgi:adenine deaminase
LFATRATARFACKKWEGGQIAYTILRGGRVLDVAAGTAEPADILIENDTIREIGAPGRSAPEGERLAVANVDNRNLYQALEPVVGSHCPGLAAAPYHIHRYGARLD